MSIHCPNICLHKTIYTISAYSHIDDSQSKPQSTIKHSYLGTSEELKDNPDLSSPNGSTDKGVMKPPPSKKKKKTVHVKLEKLDFGSL